MDSISSPNHFQPFTMINDKSDLTKFERFPKALSLGQIFLSRSKGTKIPCLRLAQTCLATAIDQSLTYL